MSVRLDPPTFGKVSEARFLIRPADSPVHPAVRSSGPSGALHPTHRSAVSPCSRAVTPASLPTVSPPGLRSGVPSYARLHEGAFRSLSSSPLFLPLLSSLLLSPHALFLFSPLSSRFVYLLSPLPSRFTSLPSRLSAPGPPVRISRVWDARKVCSSNRSCYTGTAGSSASASSQIHPSPRPPPRSVRSGSPSH